MHALNINIPISSFQFMSQARNAFFIVMNLFLEVPGYLSGLSALKEGIIIIITIIYPTEETLFRKHD